MQKARLEYGNHVKHLTRVNATVVYENDTPSVHEKPWRFESDRHLEELQVWGWDLVQSNDTVVRQQSQERLQEFINGAHKGLAPALLYHYRDGLDSVCGRVMEHSGCWKSLEPAEDACSSDEYVDPVFEPKPCNPTGKLLSGAVRKRRKVIFVIIFESEHLLFFLRSHTLLSLRSGPSPDAKTGR